MRFACIGERVSTWLLRRGALRKPRHDQCALVFGHLRQIADRHVFVVYRVGDFGRIGRDLVRRFEHDALRRLRKSRLRVFVLVFAVASGAVLIVGA